MAAGARLAVDIVGALAEMRAAGVGSLQTGFPRSSRGPGREGRAAAIVAEARPLLRSSRIDCIGAARAPRRMNP